MWWCTELEIIQHAWSTQNLFQESIRFLKIHHPFHKCFKQKKWSFLTGLVLYLRLLVSQRRRGGVGTLDTHLGKRKITFNSALGKDMLVESVIFPCQPGKMLEHVKFLGDEFCHTHFSSLTFSALVVGTSFPKVVWSKYLQLTWIDNRRWFNQPTHVVCLNCFKVGQTGVSCKPPGFLLSQEGFFVSIVRDDYLEPDSYVF